MPNLGDMTLHFPGLRSTEPETYLIDHLGIYGRQNLGPHAKGLTLGGLHLEPHDQLKGAKDIRNYLRCAKYEYEKCINTSTNLPSFGYCQNPHPVVLLHFIG